MIFIYKFFTVFFYPLIIFIIFIRKINGKEDPVRYKEKIFNSSIKSNRNKNKKLIWFHAASIGEVQSIFNLVEYYYKKNYEILITTVTKTSADIISEKYSSNKFIYHRYFPVDVPFTIRKFIDEWKPSLVVFVDSEIWPNLSIYLKKKEITSILVNARITKKTFIRWKYFLKSAKEIFSVFELCLAANKETFKYLKIFDAKNIKYFGNLKLSNEIILKEMPSQNKKILKIKNFWCAVSTHKGEDIFFLKTHLLLKKKLEEIITIIIPRHISRCLEIQRLCKNNSLSSQILNKEEIIDPTKDVIIINTIGDLTNYLALANSVFMGKSLLREKENVAGQNPIEAAKLGCKIYHGPYTYNFRDVYEQFKSLGISKEINNEELLVKDLLIDLKSTEKKNNNIIENIDLIGKKILSKSLAEIDHCLKI